jgi:hypothetical protein
MRARGVVSIAVLAAVLVLASTPVRSEVYAETDREGRFVRLHTAVARGAEGRVWDTLGAATASSLVLNPDGDLRGDGRPDYAINPLTGQPRVVWAMRVDGDFEIATSEFDGIGWSDPVRIRPAPGVADLDPKIAYRRDGVAVVTWWQRGRLPVVRAAFATADGVWYDYGVVSAAGVRAKRPSIRQEGFLTIVAYRTPGEIGIVTFLAATMSPTFGDGPTPFPLTGEGMGPDPLDIAP